MDILEIMKRRTSRRSYNNKPLTDEQVKQINEVIEYGMNKYNVKAELLVGNDDVFKGFTSSYGMFSGVNNYIVFYGKVDNQNLNEEVGMLGEEIILRATEIGLSTCWVGGTYSKKLCPVKIDDDENLVCIVAIGETKENTSFREKFIKGLSKRHSKSIDLMITSDVELPDWIINGMKAVQLAPSAVNRQPVKFVYKDNVLRASVDDINSYQGIDLGIAKIHFNLGSNKGSFKIGNNAEFIEELI